MNDNTILKSPNERLKLYSGFSITLFSVIASPMIGSILTCINLINMKKNNQAAFSIFFGIFLTTLSFTLAVLSEKYFFVLITILYGISGELLRYLFFDKFIISNNSYVKKSVLKPFLFLVLFSVIFYFFIKLYWIDFSNEFFI